MSTTGNLPFKKLALRFADEALRRRFHFEIADNLDRARRAWPDGATGACWRNESRHEIEFLPASESATIDGCTVVRYHLLRGTKKPEAITYAEFPLRAVLEDVHSLVKWALVRGHSGMADAFIVRPDAIILIRVDAGARRRFGTILHYPDLTAHDLLELAADLEREFPSRFEIEQ